MTASAPSQTHIKERVDAYLWRDPSKPLVRLREILRSQFSPLGNVAIFGGLIRDLATRGARGFKSDVDLVIDCNPSDLNVFSRAINATPNRFGGFSIITPLWKIDFWALSNTWAHKERFVNVQSFDDLVKCSFFLNDAIVYNVSDKSLIAPKGYLNNIWTNTLEINLLPNPSVDGNMVRAIRRVLGHNLRPGPKLQTFIQEHLTDEMFKHVICVELALYGFSHAAQYTGASALRDGLFRREARNAAAHGMTTQYMLPLNHLGKERR